MRLLFLFCIFILNMFSYASEFSENKQTLRINALNGLPRFIHPSLERDSESTTLAKALFEGLTRINLEGKVEYAIAKNIKISDCKTKYIIDLRKSKWSNGQDVTAAHFIDAWKASVVPNTRCIQPFHFFVIKNAKKIFLGELPIDELGVFAPNEEQIIIQLEHPVPYFTKLLADPFFSPLFEYNKTNLTVFNGPYILEKFHPGKEILLQKNPLYWDKLSVKLKKIEFVEITDAVSAYKLFQEGKLDFVGSPFSDLTEEILQNTKKIMAAPSYASYWIFINTKNDKLCQKEIRKALSLSIDREYISKNILLNAIPSKGILPEGLSFIKNSNANISLKQIKKLFYKGLKKIGCLPKDFSLTISYTATQRHANIAKYLKYQWEKTFGIRVNLDKSDWNTFYSKLNSRKYEIGGYGFYATYSDPSIFLDRFYSKETNRSQWENEEFKKLSDLAKYSKSEKLRDQYLARAEKILMEEVPLISIYTHKHLYLCNPKLKNLYPSKFLYQDLKWAYFE